MIDAQLRKQFSVPGRTNDFRRLKRKLVRVATDLDSVESAPLGLPGLDHVPISMAGQASSALPGLFPRVEIEGRHCVDGALNKTLHASVPLDEGLDLLICLNTLVSFDATAATRHRVMVRSEERIPRLIDGGLPVVLSQTFRTLIHSRLELGMKGFEQSYPGATILLFEPDQRDPKMFLANIFSYSQRRMQARARLPAPAPDAALAPQFVVPPVGAAPRADRRCRSRRCDPAPVAAGKARWPRCEPRAASARRGAR